MRSVKKTAVSFISMALAAGVATAATLITEDWNGGTTEAWAVQPVSGGPGVLSYNGALSGHDALQIVGGTSGNADVDQINAQAGSSRQFAGNRNYLAWNGTDLTQPIGLDDPTGLKVDSVSFEFYSDPLNTPPSSLDLFFFSSTASGISDGYWYYDFTASVGNDWNGPWTAIIPTSGLGGWYSQSGGVEADFFAQLADVDRIGIELAYRADSTGQTYGLDNFTLNYTSANTPIPEPGTMAVLGFALASLGVTFRRRLNESVSSMAKRG